MKECRQPQTATENQNNPNNKCFTRRNAVATTGVLILGTVAGCMNVGSDETTSEEYENIQQRPIYVSSSVDISVPDSIASESTPDDADLIVLPDTTGVEASQVVSWLEQGHAVALVGEATQNTWLTWRQSDPYVEAFEPRGRPESDPKPKVVVIWYADSQMHNSRHRWGYEPSDSEILTSIDEKLDDIPPLSE